MTFFRAKLTLEELERHEDTYGNTRVRGIEIAEVNVTGDSPADAMEQIYDHAETLYGWHRTKADDAATLDKKLFGPDATPLGPLRHIRVEPAAEAAQDGKPETKPVCGVTDPYSGIVCTKHPDHMQWTDEVHDHVHPFKPMPASSVGSCAVCSRPQSHSNHDGTEPPAEPGQEGAENEDSPEFVEQVPA